MKTMKNKEATINMNNSGALKVIVESSNTFGVYVKVIQSKRYWFVPWVSIRFLDFGELKGDKKPDES